MSKLLYVIKRNRQEAMTVTNALNGAVDVTGFSRDSILKNIIEELVQSGIYNDDVSNELYIDPVKITDIRFGYNWDYGHYNLKMKMYNDQLGTTWDEIVGYTNFGPEDIIQPGIY